MLLRRFPPQMLLVDYYRAAPDLIQFSQYWCPDTTMLDKIKVTEGLRHVAVLHVCR